MRKEREKGQVSERNVVTSENSQDFIREHAKWFFNKVPDNVQGKFVKLSL